MALDIRPCSDLHDVAAIEASMPTGRSQFHRARWEHGQGSVYLLAWAGGVPVGHLLLLAESKYAETRALFGSPEVNALGVTETHRRQGVATALMGVAADEARAGGAVRLGLAVEADNEAASGLYERLGYVRQPGLTVVDAWAWRDADGVEHEERDPCDYWLTSLRPQH